MRRVLIGVLAVLAALAAVVLFRAWRLEPPPVSDPPAAPIAFDPDSAAERLAAAIRVPSVSRDGAAADTAAFVELALRIETMFPRAHGALARETVGAGSLLYEWTGSDPSAAPVLLLAHLDVVPAEEDRWTHPPFGGAVEGGFVWGRGALDDKASALAILEAVEALLAAGFEPRRTVLVALGHDEEVGGRDGAARMGALLAARGVRPALVLDEGYAVLEGLAPGVEGPVAMVGIQEKGSVSVDLIARGPGGHSSMPPRETATLILARALLRIGDHRPETRLTGSVEATFETLAPHMDLAYRAMFGNRWLFRPLIVRILAFSPESNALVRTTTAPTMLQGSPKENVLPETARAVVNFRIHPGDSVAGILAHVVETVDDPRVEVVLRGGFGTEASPAAPDSGAAWEALSRSIRQTLGTRVVAPGLVVGATDSRHYVHLTGSVYRFLPLRLTSDNLPRVHGVDERIAVDDYARMIRFYAQLLRNVQDGLP
ncbi:MAG TPA: M20 family peptidase [Gemmatimonadota bacterium]|nr:M20 family peptidase [Gemmatimonadota bacterium]